MKNDLKSKLDEAMDAIPNLTEAQLDLLIEFQLQELANYTEKGTRAKKAQSDEDADAALDLIIKAQAASAPVIQGKFKRRF